MVALRTYVEEHRHYMSDRSGSVRGVHGRRFGGARCGEYRCCRWWVRSCCLGPLLVALGTRLGTKIVGISFPSNASRGSEIPTIFVHHLVQIGIGICALDLVLVPLFGQSSTLSRITSEEPLTIIKIHQRSMFPSHNANLASDPAR